MTWLFLSPILLSYLPLSLSLYFSLPFSQFLPILKRLWPRVVIYQAGVRVMATEVRWSILPLPMCQKPHLLHPHAPAEDMPISRPALSLEKCRLLSTLSEMDPNILM